MHEVGHAIFQEIRGHAELKDKGLEASGAEVHGLQLHGTLLEEDGHEAGHRVASRLGLVLVRVCTGR